MTTEPATSIIKCVTFIWSSDDNTILRTCIYTSDADKAASPLIKLISLEPRTNLFLTGLLRFLTHSDLYFSKILNASLWFIKITWSVVLRQEAQWQCQPSKLSPPLFPTQWVSFQGEEASLFHLKKQCDFNKTAFVLRQKRRSVYCGHQNYWSAKIKIKSISTNVC